MSLLHLQLPDQLRLLLVDDHRLFLEGLALVLQPLSQAVHIDLADSAAAADQLRRQHDYDLILLDLRLPDRSGLHLLRDWQQAGNPTPVAVLSASESPADMQAALQAGALGFIAKSSDAQSLRSAISRLLLGECLPLPLPLAGNQPAGSLTPRQQEILLLLAEGLPNKSISRQLQLSEDTVKTHLKALFQHLGVHTRTACVSVARQRGLLG